MRLIKTDYKRFKSLQASPDQSFFSVVTESSVAFWGTKDLKAAFEARPNDLMFKMLPQKEIEQS